MQTQIACTAGSIDASSQCTNPLASLSVTVTASSTVVSGTAPHVSGGDAFSPSHVFSMGIALPSSNDGLAIVSVGLAIDALASVVLVNGGADAPGGGDRSVRPSSPQAVRRAIVANANADAIASVPRLIRTTRAPPTRSAAPPNRRCGRGTREARRAARRATS